MIGSITGRIIQKSEKYIILEANGVGYKVNVSTDTVSRINSEDARLWTYTHVREDALELYGFLEIEEQKFFEMLLNVSGIGPKSAQAILSIASLSTLKKAIGTGDTSYLTKVAGIGKKTAEKIVVELRDRLGGEESDAGMKDEMDALEALKSLGYSQIEARDALKKVPTGLSTNQKIKEALKILGGK